MPDTNTQIAQQIQLKHQFYVLTLCFTVLALSIETADFDGPLVANAIELVGWLCLLFSGLLGLIRFELVPKLYQLFDAQAQLTHNKSELKKADITGGEEIFSVQDKKILPISEIVKRIDADLARANEAITERNQKIADRYVLHRWLFVAGVVALVISRGYAPAEKIVLAICPLIH